MSKDTIYREDAIKVVRHASMEFVDADTRQKLIEALPSADRPQGEWIDTTSGAHYKCSVCGYRAPMVWEDFEEVEWLSDYCPNCGARMKGADDETIRTEDI